MKREKEKKETKKKSPSRVRPNKCQYGKKYGENTVVNHRPGLQRYMSEYGRLRLNYVHLRSTVIKHYGGCITLSFPRRNIYIRRLAVRLKHFHFEQNRINQECAKPPTNFIHTFGLSSLITKYWVYTVQYLNKTLVCDPFTVVYDDL